MAPRGRVNGAATRARFLPACTAHTAVARESCGYTAGSGFMLERWSLGLPSDCATRPRQQPPVPPSPGQRAAEPGVSARSLPGNAVLTDPPGVVLPRRGTRCAGAQETHLPPPLTCSFPRAPLAPAAQLMGHGPPEPVADNRGRAPRRPVPPAVAPGGQLPLTGERSCYRGGQQSAPCPSARGVGLPGAPGLRRRKRGGCRMVHMALRFHPKCASRWKLHSGSCCRLGRAGPQLRH